MRTHAHALSMIALLACGCAPLGTELFVHGAPLSHVDAIVVLGNRPPRTDDGRVAPETARRVRRGVELFGRGFAPILVVTGGPAPGGGTEAEVMGAYARALGVPDAAILEERRARDSADNARLVVELLCGDRLDCAPRVIVVSSPYHLRRARRLFECAGAVAQVAATDVPDDVGYQASFTAYEYGIRISYILDDACARAHR